MLLLEEKIQKMEQKNLGEMVFAAEVGVIKDDDDEAEEEDDDHDGRDNDEYEQKKKTIYR